MKTIFQREMIYTRVREMRAMENLSAGRSVVHRRHPLVKLLSAFVLIVCAASFGRYDFVRLAPYVFFPAVIIPLAGLPYRILLPRLLIALPFCLFAGLTNAFFDRAAAFTAGGVTVSLGVLSLATILLKTFLCVLTALILISVTPFMELTAQLRRMKVPVIFITVFETTFRYIGVLLEEAHTMNTAYKLRAGSQKAVDMRHMGSFLGRLLLRGFNRAERVYAAMCCRGYTPDHVPPARQKFLTADAAALAAVVIPALLLRFM